MSNRFYSIPGCAPSGGEGAMNRNGPATPMRLPNGKLNPAYRGEIPVRENPQFAEFFANRAETSHSTVGLDPGQEVNIKGQGGRVLYEERDQHSGRIEQYVQVSSQTDSGTRKMVWEPDGPRTLVQTDNRRGD